MTLRLSLRVSLAAPFKGFGFDGVFERARFGAASGPFFFQRVIPFGLGVGIVNQQEPWIISQSQGLQGNYIGVLPQEFPHAHR